MKGYSVRKRRQKRFAVLLILSGVCILAILIDRRIYPIVSDYAAAKAKAHAGVRINEAVAQLLEETEITYDELIHLSRDDGGRITSAQVDAVTVDRLKTDAVGRVRRLVNEQEMTVEIPAGNLTGSAYLAGRGPGIPVKLTLSTNVTARVVSEFLDAGINQTLHIIKLEITAELFILLPIGRTTLPYTADYLLGQTVIVGEVPDAFTNVLTGEDDIEGLIEDFGAQVGE